MSDENLSLSRRVLRIAAEIVVALYVVADSAVSFLFRPMMKFMSTLRIVQRLERGINAMPPYAILVVMLVPFIIAELAKVFAVFWMSEGHLRSGMIIFISAYVVSILVCERILHAGKSKLMTIAWFAWCYNWVMALRDYLFAWFRGTFVWQKSVQLRVRAQHALTRGYDRLRSAAGLKPRNVLQRR